MRLDVAGAYRFLTHADGAGGGRVRRPAAGAVAAPAGVRPDPDRPQRTAGAARCCATPRPTGTPSSRYRWGLALGDEFLSEADLAELARAKVPLVRLRGRWVHLDPQRLRAGLAFLARGGSGQMTAGEAMRLTRLVPRGRTCRCR